ncbi:DUF4105 domain-containing protein [Salinicola aestuarinus]|uniref:Lnb N-terminal periplasmic domain-containing protein n=1 Tax=Salinicola aestuarinus TaxID=1949082 RepID=UPI000DA1497E|nr:DUF4105 domain-containing protein [Salinicola aestuarinus]
MTDTATSSRWRRGGRFLAHGLRALFLLLAVVWGSVALFLELPGPRWQVDATLVVWIALGLAALVAPRWHPRRRARVIRLLFTASLVALVLWWQSLAPRSDRDWAPDVARQLAVERVGDRVTLHNVRDFEWHSPSEATPHWETRSYDLTTLASVDMIVSYWMGPAIAHTLVSFGFADGRYLTFSVEIRRERDEAFSIVGGVFKQFELNLIAADENDILRLRSNVRGEDVYLYSVALAPDARRELFLAYLDEARKLRREPAFYNTLTSNCTTLVFDMVDRIVDGLPRDVRLILSGYLPAYVHDVGGLASGVSLETLRQRGHINARAQAIPYEDGSRAFSRAIRDGVPVAGQAAEKASEATPAETDDESTGESAEDDATHGGPATS